MSHDTSTCMDMDCTICFPDYIPQSGDIVRDRSGREWLVTFVGVSRNGKGRLMELKNGSGHYSDIPMHTQDSFPYGVYVKIN